MKKTILTKIAFLLAFLIVGVMSCKKEEIEPEPDPELPEAALVKVLFTDPADGTTGVEYTANDVVVYLVDQPVVVALISPMEPTQLEVLAADGSVLQTITTFTAAGENFVSANYSTTVEDLGLSFGGRTTLKLRASFPVGEGVGTINNDFIVQWGEVSTDKTGVELIKSDGTVMNLSVTPNDASMDVLTFGNDLFGFDMGLQTENKFVTIDGVDIGGGEDILDFMYLQDYTVSLWAKSSVGDNGDPSLFGNADWSSSANAGMTFAYKGDKWKTVVVDVDYETNGRYNEGTGGTGPGGTDLRVDDDVWHLYTFTADRAGNGTIYQDGVALVTADMSHVLNFESGLPWTVGQDGTGAYQADRGDGFIQGLVANVQIYDYVRTIFRTS